MTGPEPVTVTGSAVLVMVTAGWRTSDTWMSVSHSGFPSRGAPGAGPPVQTVTELTTSPIWGDGTVYDLVRSTEVPGARDSIVPIVPPSRSSTTVRLVRTTSPVLATVKV